MLSTALLGAAAPLPEGWPAATASLTLRGHSRGVNALAVDFGLRRAVSASDDNTLKVWDLDTGDCIQTLRGHWGDVNAVAANFSLRRAVSGSDDNKLKVWDLDTGNCKQTLQGHFGDVKAVAADFSLHRAVGGSDDNKTLKVWDLDTGNCNQTLQGHSDNVTAVAADFRLQRAVSGSWDKTLKVWDLHTGDCLRTLRGHDGHLQAVAADFSRHLAVSASDDWTMKVWPLEAEYEPGLHLEDKGKPCRSGMHIQAAAGCCPFPGCFHNAAQEVNEEDEPLGCFVKGGAMHFNDGASPTMSSAQSQAACWDKEWGPPICTCPGGRAAFGCSQAGKFMCDFPEPTAEEWLKIVGVVFGLTVWFFVFQGTAQLCGGVEGPFTWQEVGRQDVPLGAQRAAMRSIMSPTLATTARLGLAVAGRLVFPMMLAWLATSKNERSRWTADLPVRRFLVLVAVTAPGLPYMLKDLLLCDMPKETDLLSLFLPARVGLLGAARPRDGRLSAVVTIVRLPLLLTVFVIFTDISGLDVVWPWPKDVLDAAIAHGATGARQLEVLTKAGLVEQVNVMTGLLLIFGVLAALDVLVTVVVLCYPPTHRLLQGEQTQPAQEMHDVIWKVAGALTSHELTLDAEVRRDLTVGSLVDAIAMVEQGTGQASGAEEKSTEQPERIKFCCQGWAADSQVVTAQTEPEHRKPGVTGLPARVRDKKVEVVVRFWSSTGGIIVLLSLPGVLAFAFSIWCVWPRGTFHWSWKSLLSLASHLPIAASLVASLALPAAVLLVEGWRLDVQQRVHKFFRSLSSIGILVEKEVALLLLDIALDVSAFINYRRTGQKWFAIAALMTFMVTFINSFGDLIYALKEYQKSLDRGFHTDRFYDLKRQEVSVEGVASLLLNCYGLPWAVSDWPTLGIQMGTISLSLYHVVSLAIEREMGLVKSPGLVLRPSVSPHESRTERALLTSDATLERM